MFDTSALNKTILLYGQPGCWKTTEAMRFAKWIYARTGKRTRFISADEGWMTALPEIRAGLVIPLLIQGAENVLPLLRWLRRGYWPSKIGPDGELIDRKLIAPTDKTWKEIGAYIVEGLSSIGELVMADLRAHQRKMKDDAIGEFSQAPSKEWGIAAEERFSHNARWYYDSTQYNIHEMIGGFAALPVTRVMFTAHEQAAEDQDTKMPIRGPAIVGRAATPKVQAWVGDTIHMEDFPMKVDGMIGTQKLTTVISRVRCFFVKHADPKFENIFYPANNRVPVEKLDELMKAFPGGFFAPTTESGIDKFLDIEERLIAEAAAVRSASKVGAP